MRQGGRYVVDEKTGKPERVEWTKTPAEVAAEKDLKTAPKASEKGSKGK